MPEEKSESPHNVFISWSGNRSRHVAEALHEWLPMVIQAAKPFLSKRDIDKGSRWHIELARALEVTKVGVVCLTPENTSAPWLLFEAGALSKTVDRGTLVCTYLLAGFQPSDVPPPLSEFQATKSEKDETRQMIQSINKAIGSPVSEHTLNKVFDAFWPMLEAKLSCLPNPETNVPPRRKLDDMVSELLDLGRAAAKSRESVEVLDRYIPTLELLMHLIETNTPIVGSPPVAPSGGLLTSTLSSPFALDPINKTGEPSIKVNLSESMWTSAPPPKPLKVNE